MIDRGSVIKHRSRPEWGLGIVVEIGTEKRVDVEFAHKGQVKLKWALAEQHIEAIELDPSPPPKELMGGILWSFTGKPIPELEDFGKAVGDYHQKVAPDKDPWSPDEVVVKRPVIEVMYRCQRGRKQLEPWLRIFADEEEGFRAVELLWKLHNAVVKDLKKIDLHFFEGLSLSPKTAESTVPLYHMLQGSGD